MDFGIKSAAGTLDAIKVTVPTDDSTGSVLLKAAIHFRLAIRRMLRRKKQRSKPGQPPSSHTDYLKDFVTYAYDIGSAGVAAAGTVLIGPTLGGKVADRIFYKPEAGKTIPRVLEEGGDVSLLEFLLPGFEETQWGGKWKRANKRNRKKAMGQPTRLRNVHIKARPYVMPAVEKGANTFLRFWADSIGKSIV